MATPIHWRMPTLKPKIRSAMHREDHDAGGEHRLDDRQRGEGKGGDVEEPRAGGDGHADREPLAGVQLLSRPERMTDVDRGSLVGALVLVEKAQLRRDRAGEREQDAQIKRHVSSYVDSNRNSSPNVLNRTKSPASPSLHRFPTVRALAPDGCGQPSAGYEDSLKPACQTPRMGVWRALILAAVFAGCGSDASAASLKGSVTYGKSGGIAGLAQKLSIKPDGRGVASSLNSKNSFKLSKTALKSLTSAVAKAKLADTKSKKDTVEGADGFTYGVGYRGHKVDLERLQRRAARARDAPVHPARRTLRALLALPARRPLLLIDVDGVLSLFGTGRRARADRRRPALPLQRAAAGAATPSRKTSSASGAPAGRTAPTATCRTCWTSPRAGRTSTSTQSPARTGSSAASTPTRAPTPARVDRRPPRRCLPSMGRGTPRPNLARHDSIPRSA